jgi:hypothetical protein
VLCLALCASIVPARAVLFSDATLSLGLRDDARVFLNVTNDYFAPPPAVAVELVRRSRVPEDDYPVILLLARASKRPAEEILRSRLDYLSWSDIMFQQHVSPAVLFAGIDRDPGPPYGKAWGYWRKHPRGERLAIRDRDVIDLAKIQVAAGYHRVSPYTIIAERRKGVTVEHYVAEKNRGRYPRGKSGGGSSHNRGSARGQGPDKKKGPDKPKAHGNPHHHD